MPEPYRILSSPVRLPGELRVAQLAALVSADALCRRARARGQETEWVPLTLAGDLAGQHATERELAKEGLDRATLGRDAFVERVREREAQARVRLAETVASLGVDADLDAGAIDSEAAVRAATTAFVRLFEQGRLQHMERVVDTCPRCETVIDLVDGEPGVIESEALLVDVPLDLPAGAHPASVRLALAAPELVLGAVAIVVPEGDPAAGMTATLPMVGRQVDVIAGGPGVERPALLVPAHDPDDLEVARALGLAPVEVFDAEGVVRPGGPLEGLPRYAARAAATKLLHDEGVAMGSEACEEPVSRCRRCGTVLVPRLGRHWFLAMADLELAAADAVRDADIGFAPAAARDELLARAGTGGEWCLSHQVWAGQPVPVARCLDCGQVAVAVQGDTSCGKCMGMLAPDDSVLDARFVGAVAVLAAGGWPDDETGPADRAPATTFVVGPTGVARWALPVAALAVRLTGSLPFSRVAVHQAPDGDVTIAEVDELVARCGAPAVRTALVAGGLDVAAAAALVHALDDAPAGDGRYDDVAPAWDAAFDAGTPAPAVAVLTSVLTSGVAPGEAARLRDLAAPVLGAAPPTSA